MLKESIDLYGAKRNQEYPLLNAGILLILYFFDRCRVRAEVNMKSTYITMNLEEAALRVAVSDTSMT